VIIFARDLSGTLFVNGGAVPISGGPATTANTDLIVASGLDGRRRHHPRPGGRVLPAASLNGGNGNDTLTGGSSNDMLSGDAGVDT
jgi:Ca2+-binding RTX toxin-like protein